MGRSRRLASVVMLTVWCAGMLCPAPLLAKSPGGVSPPPRTSGKILSRGQIGALGSSRMRVYQKLFLAPYSPPVKVEAWNGLSPVGTDMFAFAKTPVTVDWAREDVNWWYRCSCGDGRVASLVWQMGRFDFPQTAQGWEHPPGLVASGKVAAPGKPGQWALFQVDYTYVAPSPKGPRFDWQAMPKMTAAQKPRIQQQGKPPVASGAKKPDDRFGNLRNVGPERETQLSQAVRKGLLALPLPATFYVRVVALDARGAVLGRPSASAVLTFAPPRGKSTITIYKEGFGHPTLTVTRYEPPRPDAPDCLCIYKVLQDVRNPLSGKVMLAAGSYVDVCQPEDSSLLDDIGDAVSGFFDALGSLVNWVAQVYESAKNLLVSAVVSALKGTVGCGGACQTLVSTALEAGLAAVGLPPTLPNFDQLVDMGADYLAAQIAAEAGIPDDVAKQAMESFVGEVRKAGGGVAAGGGALWVPDPDRQYKPGYFLVQVTNRGAQPSRAVVMRFTPRDSSTYRKSEVPIPPLKPGQSLDVPVFLQPADDPSAWRGLLPTAADVPNLDVYVQKVQAAAAARAAWEQKYLNATTVFDATTQEPASGTTFSQVTANLAGSKAFFTH